MKMTTKIMMIREIGKGKEEIKKEVMVMKKTMILVTQEIHIHGEDLEV
jgi:hypothetical protein